METICLEQIDNHPYTFLDTTSQNLWASLLAVVGQELEEVPSHWLEEAEFFSETSI